MESREPARSRAGVFFAFLAVAVVVASVIGTLAATGRFSLSSAAGARPGVLDHMLRIDTVRSAHLFCPSAPSFSPDGSQFAVLGTGISCSDPSAVLPYRGQHKLVVYDVQTGAVRRVVELDQFFQPNVAGPCTGVTVSAVQFTGLGWSPDNDHFGVLFAAFNAPNSLLPDYLACSGLLSLSIDSGTAAYINGDAGFFDAPTGYAGYPIWNLTQITISPAQPVTPSLVYGWTNNGTPLSVSPLSGQPLSQLPIRAGHDYPVGNPASDSTYTLWQPGIVAGPEVFAGGAASPNDDDVFVTQFASWTPSGQYVTVIVDGVLLAPPDHSALSLAPTPTSATTAPVMPLPSQLAEVPARDPALVAVQGQVGVNGWAITAWNDKGSILASIDCNDVAHARLELRETQAATLVGSVPLDFPSGDTGCSVFDSSVATGDYPNPNLSMQWAPDGSHLLLSDQLGNTVTLWHVASSSSSAA